MTSSVSTIAPPPPAPADPPPPLSPSGRTAVRALLVAAATVLVVGTVASLAVLAFGISTFRVITDSKPLPSALRSLIVDTGPVPVAVKIITDRQTREPRADLRMVNSVRASANPLAVDTDRAEARITINGEPSPFLRWSRAGQLTVVLPPDLARGLTVTTQQHTGVLIAKADLGQLVAQTDDGVVVLGGSARSIEVHNVNGEVVSDDPIVVSESFTATSVSGDIKVDFAGTAPRTVDVASRDGDVVIALPGRGPYVVNADTTEHRGDAVIRVPQTADRAAAAGVVTARSETGDVIIDRQR